MEGIPLLLCRELNKIFQRRQKAAKRRFNTILQYYRRKKRLDVFKIFHELLIQKVMVDRRFWREPSRGKSLFWEEVVSKWTEDKLWLENFRMSKQSFLFICHELRDSLKKENTRFRNAVSVEKRVAICLWHLSTGEDLRSLGWRFDVAKSTACQIVNAVCQAFVEVLLPRVIVWPTGNYLDSVLEGFKNEWGFPQCGGAIDGTHIPIIAPRDCPANFYNRKGFYSIVMQVVVDHQYRFTDINIKWPGKVHDARIFSNSKLYTKGENQTLFLDSSEEISGCNVPIMLIADSAYPLLPWLMKGYQDRGNLSVAQLHFNYRLSRARMVVEKAIGHLKGRFRCLLKRNETSLTYLPAKIAACCILHNLCEMKGEVFEEDWFITDVNNNENSSDTCNEADSSSEDIRQALTDHFFQNR